MKFITSTVLFLVAIAFVAVEGVTNDFDSQQLRGADAEYEDASFDNEQRNLARGWTEHILLTAKVEATRKARKEASAAEAKRQKQEAQKAESELLDAAKIDAADAFLAVVESSQNMHESSTVALAAAEAFVSKFNVEAKRAEEANKREAKKGGARH
mmetsp:Transcript_28059/g.39648  ORF Transcript_28059/g.39648 Transcript_28059/m.39648 type:complete len:156 (-) Transcript_28059:313-780(-)|eukprot:CAMPEP_0202458182 /NCGR_PEP_ID=MMETSP1360-20130828/22594_1 /ASSEMBLY_ACC=CAM_ASM_000848 /TAXON_ID=515479 /ORGANISM="Licmophora paradoxa, Strain CCMP2313" /LENGTH=155 /DNA_ID=CAMNT_0049078605 /DNA_START=85 /DNA_END=552 /DNA_ORIENTATION=+